MKNEKSDNESGTKRNVYALGFVSLLNDTASEMIYPLLPAFLVSLGAGPVALGLIEGVAEATSSLLKMAFGIVADRLKKRKLIFSGGYILSNAVRPLMGAAISWWHIFIVRFIDRTGKGIRTSPRDALLADSVPESLRGTAFGIQRAMDNAGAFIGPLLAAGLMAFFGLTYRPLFYLSAVPGAVAVCVVLLAVREIPPKPKEASSPGGSTPLASEGGAIGGTFYRYLAAVGLFTLGNSSDAFLLLRAQNLGIAVFLLPVVWTVFNASKSLLAAPGGWLSDRLGRRAVLIAGWLVYSVIYFGFAFASRPIHAWLLFIAYGLHFGLTEGAERALVADLAPSARLGTFYGAFHLVVGVMALPASILFGLIWKFAGAGAAFTLGATLALAASVVMLTVKRPTDSSNSASI